MLGVEGKGFGHTRSDYDIRITHLRFDFFVHIVQNSMAALFATESLRQGCYENVVFNTIYRDVNHCPLDC